jgi:hypothetical protein
VEFIKKIREKLLEKNRYEMHKMMEFKDTRTWINFEESKNVVSLRNLVKLWRLSRLSGDEFMEMIAKEVESHSEQPK